MNEKLSGALVKKDLLKVSRFPLKRLDQNIKMNMPPTNPDEKPTMVYEEVKLVLSLGCELFLTDLLINAQEKMNSLRRDSSSTDESLSNEVIIATIKEHKKLDFLDNDEFY